MASVNVERSSVVVSIAKGLVPTADIVLGTIGGTLLTDGVKIELLEVVPNYKVAINLVHNATSTTALEYSHSEITVTRGAAISLDNVVDTVAGAVQGVAVLLVDSTPTTDTYLVVIVHLNA